MATRDVIIPVGVITDAITGDGKGMRNNVGRGYTGGVIREGNWNLVILWRSWKLEIDIEIVGLI